MSSERLLLTHASRANHTHTHRDGGATFVMELTLTNQSDTPMSDFAVQFNLNTLGLVPAAGMDGTSLAPHGGSTELSLPLTRVPTHQQPCQPPNALQVALKNDRGIYYFEVLIVGEGAPLA